MPATVSINFIGNPEVERALCAEVELLFKEYPGNWTVSILGSQINTVWELKVSAPDGRRERIRRLHTEDGHDTETIFGVLKKITLELLGRPG